MKENLKSMVTYLDHFLMWWECAMRIFVCSLVEYELDDGATGQIFVCSLVEYVSDNGATGRILSVP